MHIMKNNDVDSNECVFMCAKNKEVDEINTKYFETNTNNIKNDINKTSKNHAQHKSIFMKTLNYHNINRRLLFINLSASKYL